MKAPDETFARELNKVMAQSGIIVNSEATAAFVRSQLDRLVDQPTRSRIMALSVKAKVLNDEIWEQQRALNASLGEELGTYVLQVVLGVRPLRLPAEKESA